MKACACCLVFALIVAIDAAGGEVASSACSSSFAVDTEIATNSTLIVDGSILPFRLDYSPSLWWDKTGGGGTARITANDQVILEATHDGTFLWNPSIAGVYSIKCISANNVTIEKRFNVVAPMVTIEREGYNLCKLTASDGVSEIRYTTDGTAPTADSPLYTEPFEVPPSRLSTVRAATFAAGCPQGEIAFAHFNPVASSVSAAQVNCAIDNSGGTKMVGYDALPLTYDTEWEGDASSSMELRVDGNLIATRTGAGDVAWTPEHDGVNLLTLRTINATGQTLAEYSAQYDVVPRTVIISNGDVAPLRERYPGLCHWITNITIEAGVTDIGASAFVECSGLTSITIPDSVTSIGDSAFRGCSGLTSLTIPDSVTNLGMRVAFNPGNWTRVEADAEGCTSAYRPDVTSSSVSSEMSLTVEGPLDWSFKWKTPVEGYDSMKVRIEYGYGGVGEIEWCGAGGSWEEFQCQMTEGKNTISWTYIKRWYGAGSGDDCGCVAFDLPANAFSIFEGCTGLTSVTMPERFKPLFGDTLNGCPISYYGFKIGKVCGGGWWGSPFVEHEIWENNDVGLYGDEYAFIPVMGNGTITPVIFYGDTPAAYLGHVSVWTDEQMLKKFVPSGISPSSWDNGGWKWECETSNGFYSWAKGIWPDNKIVAGRRWIVVPANVVNVWAGVTSFRVGISGTKEISDTIIVVPSEDFSQNGLLSELTPNDFIHGITISGYFDFDAWYDELVMFVNDAYDYYSEDLPRMQTFELVAGRVMTFKVAVPSAGTLVVSSKDDADDSLAMKEVFSVKGDGIVSDKVAVKSNDYDSQDYRYDDTNFWKASYASHVRRIEVSKTTTLTFTSLTGDDVCEFNRMYFFPRDVKSVAIDVGYAQREYLADLYPRIYVQGYVTGGGVYRSGESATLKAVSGEGQEFDHWEVRFGNLTLTEAQKRNPTLSFTVTDAMCGAMADEEQIFLSAFWKPKYKVTVLPSIVGAGTVTGTGRYFEGETVTLSATAAEGCAFVKWSDGETAATRQIKVVAADVERVIYACFEAPNGVPIGSSYGPFIAGARVEFDVGLVGYTAKGLPSGLTYTTKTGIVSGSVKVEGVYDVTFSKKGEEDVLIQIVVRKAHEVSFDANGGMPKIQTIAQFFGDPFILPQDPTLAGHEFMGWWTARDGGEKVTGNAVFNEGAYTHLYAHWTANTYRVAFDPNGGMGEMSAQTMTYDQEAQLSFGQFANMDLLFRGWATVAGGGVVYHDGATVKNLTAVADDVVTLYAVWQEKPAEMLACEAALDGAGVVTMDANDNIVMALTNDVSGTVEIPDNVGAVTIDLNGHSMVGDGGPAIRIVKGDGDGGATQLAIVDMSEGEKGQILGGGESAGIEVAEDAAPSVRFDVEEGVGVFNGDGSEQPWWELCPIEATLVAGEYFKATLVELGYDVPTNGAPYSVVARGLPAGLKLVSNAAVKDKKGKVVIKAKSEWWIEGVPTAAVDFFTNPPYLVITVDGVAGVHALPIEVVAQDVTMLEDLALGQTVNEQYYLPGVTSGWAVSGLPTGLKFTAKMLTTSKKVGKKTVVTTNALPYSVYGKTTKAGLFTITAKKKVGAYYEAMKYRVLVKPRAVDETLFGEELTNITTMAYVPFEWDLTNDVAAVGGKVAKVAGLPVGLTFTAKDTYAYTNAKKKTGKYLKQYGQTIVGTPTKPGTYVVTFTKNVTTGTGKKKKTVAKTAQILWTVTANDANLELGFNTAGGVIEGGTVGLKYGDLLAFTATDGATVTASGLPKGITLANLGGGSYAFTGFTTKAGTYLVTVKATLNGKTVTQRMALEVDGLPSWAKGTFNGYIAGADGATNGLAAITVSSVGKISGKFQEGGTNWTFTAASYTGYDDAAPAYSVPVVAKYSCKAKEKVKVKGKWTTKTVTKSVARNFTLRVGQDALGGIATMEEVDGSAVNAWQNLWGQADYKALGKRLFSTKSGKKTLAYRTFTIKGTDDVGAEMGLTDAMSLSLKVTTAGAVTATMSFDTGTKSKGKAVIYKPTCATVVIPLSAADAEEFEGEAILFFAPSTANNFPGFAGAAPF